MEPLHHTANPTRFRGRAGQPQKLEAELGSRSRSACIWREGKCRLGPIRWGGRGCQLTLILS